MGDGDYKEGSEEGRLVEGGGNSEIMKKAFVRIFMCFILIFPRWWRKKERREGQRAFLSARENYFDPMQSNFWAADVQTFSVYFVRQSLKETDAECIILYSLLLLSYIIMINIQWVPS